MNWNNNKILLFCVLLGVCLGSAATAFSAVADFDQSVVQIIVTYQEYDSALPWRKKSPQVRNGYGVIIEGGLVMTTENLVRNHTLVEIRKTRSSMKIPASVTLSDNQSGLALLNIKNQAAALDMRSVKIASAIDQDAQLTIVQFDYTGQIQTGTGHISEISMASLPESQSITLVAQVLTDLAITGNGGTPVFTKDNTLFGIVIRYNNNTNICYVLPYSILYKFIQASKIRPFPGIASAGLLWTPLIDPFKQAFLGLKKDQTGILVQRMLPGSDHTLLPDDVIIEWDGYALDSQGYYHDPDFGRILFSYLIKGRGSPGDITPVTVIRNKQPIHLKLKLKNLQDKDATISYNITGEQEEYLVEGGLVIRELTVDYLKMFGSKWRVMTDTRLLHLYLTRNQITDNPNDHIVILSCVFPDLINIGYENLRNQVITAVNGEPIRNLADVFRIAQRDGTIHRISLQSMKIDIVLNPERIPSANARIARNYHIPRLRYQHPD